MTVLATFGVTSPLSQPFYTGTSTTVDTIPAIYPIGINGRGFNLDLASNEYVHESVPLLRPQADDSSTPGEASINPDDLWRRPMSTWHLGAGLRIADAEADAPPGRFYTSKGIDPWTYGEFSLLPDVDEKRSSVETNMALAVAGDHLYLTDGVSIVYTTDVTVDTPTWSTITGEPATSPTAITSDGYSVWSAHGADGVYVTTRGGSGTASSFTGTVAGVKYLKGRLFAWSTDKLYNLVTPGAIPAALLDHPNTDFAWVDVAEAAGFYFPAGYSGDKSTVYKTSVQADGTGLEVPVVAAELPDGEIIRSIHGYLGFLLIGTDKGIRFGAPDGEGNVELGGLIEDAPETRCFEGQGSFVWFGWSQYDASSTGLGRMDLGEFNGTKPSYASDLMATDDGNVLSVVTFQDIHVFAVSGLGIYAQATDKVASGQIEMGRFTYGLFDNKVSMYLNVNHMPLAGTLSAELAKDHADYVSIGAESLTPGSVRSDFSTNRARGQTFDIRLTLARDADVTTTGPTVTFLTLRSFPVTARTERIVLPLLIGTHERQRTGSSNARDIVDDLAYLERLERDGSPITLQEGQMTSIVVPEEHQWRPHHYEPDALAFAGTYLFRVKRFASE